MPDGLPVAIPVRDLQLVAGGGLTITGTLIFFGGVTHAAQPINVNTLLGAGMAAGGLWLLWNAARNR